MSISSIRQSAAATKYNELRKASSALFETNDCSVKAVAATMGCSYMKAHQALSKAGRKDRKGAYTNQIHSAIESLGGNVHYKFAETKLHAKSTTKKLSPKLDPSKRYLVYTASHVSAIVDGGMVDWAADRQKRVKTIWEVTGGCEVKPVAPAKPEVKPEVKPAVKPSRRPRVTLTLDDVLFIRDAYANHGWTITQLSRKYGTSTTCIHNVVNRKTWANVK